MSKNIRISVFPYDDEYHLVVDVNNHFYTKHKAPRKEDKLKQLLIDAYDYLTADI